MVNLFASVGKLKNSRVAKVFQILAVEEGRAALAVLKGSVDAVGAAVRWPGTLPIW